MTATEFASLVRGTKRCGQGYSAFCPAHDDKRQSLTFLDGNDGLLVKCHAGCSLETVTKALKLTVSELFNTDDGAKLAPSVASVAKAYQCQDEGGRLLYVVHRRQSAGGKKTFRCSRPDGHGGWIHNLDGVRRVLYRLPELRGLKIVYVVEGEKDAETLCRLGLPATTNCAGAGSWRAGLHRATSRGRG